MEARPDRSLEILERTPAVLRALLTGLSSEWLAGDEGPATWSTRDNLAHLVQGEEEDWVARILHVLEHGESRPFTPFDRAGFQERHAGKETPELLDLFENLRRENLAILLGLNLTPELQARRGTHPALGTVTLSELLSTWTVHDLSHIAQIARVMAKQYAGSVGPWREYLPILGV